MYLGWRVVWGLYHVVWLIYNWIDSSEDVERGFWFIYLTNWSYFILSTSAVVRAVITTYYFFHQGTFVTEAPQKQC